MTNKKPSQKDDILAYIKKHGSITQADAIKMGCYRLAAMIADLKKKGIPIDVTYEQVVKVNGKTTRIARYKVVEEL